MPEPVLDQRVRQALADAAGSVHPDPRARERLLGTLDRRRARARLVAAGSVAAAVLAAGLGVGLTAGSGPRSDSAVGRTTHRSAASGACGTVSVAGAAPACAGTLVVAGTAASGTAASASPASTNAASGTAASANGVFGAATGAAATPSQGALSTRVAGTVVHVGQRVTVRLPPVPGSRWSAPAAGTLLHRVGVRQGGTGSGLTAAFVAEHAGTAVVQAAAEPPCAAVAHRSSGAAACPGGPSATWTLSLTVSR